MLQVIKNSPPDFQAVIFILSFFFVVALLDAIFWKSSMPTHRMIDPSMMTKSRLNAAPSVWLSTIEKRIMVLETALKNDYAHAFGDAANKIIEPCFRSNARSRTARYVK